MSPHRPCASPGHSLDSPLPVPHMPEPGPGTGLADEATPRPHRDEAGKGRLQLWNALPGGGWAMPTTYSIMDSAICLMVPLSELVSPKAGPWSMLWVLALFSSRSRDRAMEKLSIDTSDSKFVSLLHSVHLSTFPDTSSSPFSALSRSPMLPLGDVGFWRLALGLTDSWLPAAAGSGLSSWLTRACANSKKMESDL